MKLKVHHLWGLLFIISMGIFFYAYEFFLRISPSVLVGGLMHYFSIDAFEITKLLALYYFAYTLGQIPAGLILDRYPVKLTLALASLACTIGLYLFIMSTDINIARTGRFIIGFASSFAFIAVLKMGRVYLPQRYFTRIVGITVAIGTLAASYANVLASTFDHDRITTIFYISIMVGLILSIIFMISQLYESKVKVLDKQESYSKKQILALIKNPYLWLNGFIGGLFYLPSCVLSDIWGSYFFHTHFHLSLTLSAYVITWLFIGWMVGSPIMGYLADHYHKTKALLAINAAICAITFTYLMGSKNLSLEPLCIIVFLLGFCSSSQLIIWRIFHHIAPIDLAATGIALTNMMIMLTCALGQLFIGFLLGLNQNSSNIESYLSADYNRGMVILPIALIIGIILVRFLPRTEK